jgi:hypothetical protein
VTVDQLREALAPMPGHIPVYVAVNSDQENGGGADTDYLYTLDCSVGNFPSHGRMAVIQINYDPS